MESYDLISFHFSGDSIIDNDEVFTISPLQIHCINRRLLLPLPTCGKYAFPDMELYWAVLPLLR